MFPANIYAFFLVFDVYYWYKSSSNTHKICFIHDIKASHQFGRLGVERGVGLGTFHENKREKRFTTYTKPIVYRMRVALYVSISHRQWLPQCPFGKPKMPVLHCKNGLFTPLNAYSQKNAVNPIPPIPPILYGVINQTDTQLRVGKNFSPTSHPHSTHISPWLRKLRPAWSIYWHRRMRMLHRTFLPATVRIVWCRDSYYQHDSCVHPVLTQPK